MLFPLNCWYGAFCLKISPDDRCAHLSGTLALRLRPRQQAPVPGYAGSAPPGKIPPAHQSEAVSTQHQELHTPCSVCGLLSKSGTSGTERAHTHTHTLDMNGVELRLLLAPAGDGVLREFQASLCQHQHHRAAVQRPPPLFRRLLCDPRLPEEVLFP